MKTAFHPAAEAELPTVLGLMRDYYAYDGLTFDEAKASRALHALFGNPVFGQAFVITQGDKSIGYLILTYGFSLEFHGRDAFIDELFIVEAARGGGAGKRALRFAEDHCRAIGIKTLHLAVEKSNRKARALYEKSGFPDKGRSLLSKRL